MLLCNMQMNFDIATKARERMIKENTLNEYQSLPQDDEQIAET